MHTAELVTQAAEIAVTDHLDKNPADVMPVEIFARDQERIKLELGFERLFELERIDLQQLQRLNHLKRKLLLKFE